MLSTPRQTYPERAPTCVPARTITLAEVPSGFAKMTQPAAAELGATNVVTRPHSTLAATATSAVAPKRIATAHSAPIRYRTCASSLLAYRNAVPSDRGVH